jgi:glucose/arabinose dehydrogenase
MSTPGSTGQTQNRIVRYRYEDGSLAEDKIIIERIPGAVYHDGGRMEFGPDERLYITTGDATTAEIAQDTQSLGGKILRLEDDGAIPTDNPYGNAVYSYGHRNPQGLTWDSAGRLWESEHGRSGLLSGLDEINLIEAGANYGWPTIEGDETQNGMRAPVIHSGVADTWAPASLAFLNSSLFFGGLRGEALYKAVLSGTEIVEIKEHFKGEFGRIRTVRVGPDDMLYLTTSNTDGRGDSMQGDDKILRINPANLE